MPKKKNHEHNNKYVTEQLDNNSTPLVLIMTNFAPTSNIFNKPYIYFSACYSIRNIQCQSFR